MSNSSPIETLKKWTTLVQMCHCKDRAVAIAHEMKFLGDPMKYYVSDSENESET